MRVPRMITAALLLAACERAERPDSASSMDSISAVPATAARTDSAARPAEPVPAASDTGMTVVVRRMEPGRYLLTGRTRLADLLQLSVEDGRRVLFGPAEIAVAGGAFTAEARLEPTDQRTVFVYLADPGGPRQWVIPIPRDSAAVNWSGDTAAGMEQR